MFMNTTQDLAKFKNANLNTLLMESQEALPTFNSASKRTLKQQSLLRTDRSSRAKNLMFLLTSSAKKQTTTQSNLHQTMCSFKDSTKGQPRHNFFKFLVILARFPLLWFRGTTKMTHCQTLASFASKRLSQPSQLSNPWINKSNRTAAIYLCSSTLLGAKMIFFTTRAKQQSIKTLLKTFLQTCLWRWFLQRQLRLKFKSFSSPMGTSLA